MSPDEFRAIALSFPDTAESSHMNHPDFRVCGKVFATLGYPNRQWGVVGLTPAEQTLLCEAEPDVFRPVNGAWGRTGSTQVNLSAARKPSVERALEAAWLNQKAKSAARKPTRKPRTGAR